MMKMMMMMMMVMMMMRMMMMILMMMMKMMMMTMMMMTMMMIPSCSSALWLLHSVATTLTAVLLEQHPILSHRKKWDFLNVFADLQNSQQFKIYCQQNLVTYIANHQSKPSPPFESMHHHQKPLSTSPNEKSEEQPSGWRKQEYLDPSPLIKRDNLLCHKSQINRFFLRKQKD